MKKVFRILSMMVILTIVISLFSSIAALEIKEYPLDMDVKSAVLMEANTGKILFGLNEHEMLPPASVTKIMTLLLVFEYIENDNMKFTDTLTVSEYASSMGGSQVYLEPGEQMCVEDLIKCVIIASANDAAVTLAENVAGSEEAFVTMMNSKAKELGMKNTNFENVTGLDDDVNNHLTSAYDIALMSKQLIKFDKVSQYATIWMDTIRNGEFGLTNTNRLVRYYNGITGLKTGSTSKAGFCVSATAKRDGIELIAVIMGANSSETRNAYATKLLDFGFSNYGIYTNKGREVGKIKVECGNKDYITVRFDDNAILENKPNINRITYTIKLNEKAIAPVEIGDVVGQVTYYLNEKEIYKQDIYSTEKVSKLTFWEYLLKISKYFFNI